MPNVQRIDDVTVIELEAEYESLDMLAIQKIGEDLQRIASAAQPPRVVFDLSRTTFVGSSFLDVLIRSWKRLREREGRMVICGLDPLIAKVFEVAKLDALWPQCDTVSEAVAAANGESGTETS